MPNNSIRWKRFTRTSYALFNSLHKEVSIGVLTVAMLQSAGLKARTPMAYMTVGNGVAVDEQLAEADSLGIALQSVEVTGTRVPLTEIQAPRLVTVLHAADIKAAAVHSINDLLEYAVGVDVRQRGEMGVQTDVSVRGGTFDQVTLLLNGVNISSPHTGHLTADFPLSVDDIERVEVVEGPAARVFGTSAFTGVVNVVTRQPVEKANATIHLHGGDYGYGGGNARVGIGSRVGRNGHFANTLSGGYHRADGATPNSDFSNTHLFYQARYTDDNVAVSAQAGYSYKPYGANTFYGASSTDQWESNERWMAAARAETQAGRLHLSQQLYWNRWNDHYQWHRNVTPGGENYHQVDVYGAGVNAWLESRWGKTSFGAEVRSDAIWSTNLGKVLEDDRQRPTAGHDANPDRRYTRYDQRTNLSAFLEHDILLPQWTISLGVLANQNTGLDNKWRLYPGVDVSYRPADEWRIYASWNIALRMPTFTDLYYSGANIEGNNHLHPERTNDVSLGAKYRAAGVDLTAQLFYSHKSNMIDWVVYEDDTYDAAGQQTESSTWKYRSGNFRLDNCGAELLAAFMPREVWGQQFPLRRLSAQYAYISESIEYYRPVVLSKYAMEYLRHKVVLQADGRIAGNLNASLSWRWQEREGVGNGSYALLDARLSWDKAKYSAYIDCSNLLDKTYYDYIIVPQPGRWVKAGVVINL